MHATLVVLIDREREEQKNSNDASTSKDYSTHYANEAMSIESNTFIRAYKVSCSLINMIDSISTKNLFHCLLSWPMAK
jgi:hypothetical protein